LKRIGIFAATRWECRAVQYALRIEATQRRAGYRVVIGRRGDCRVHLVQTGIGPAKARGACRAAFQHQPLDLVISSGLACALTTSSIGELFVGTEVLTPGVGTTEFGATIVCDRHYADLALRAAHSAGLPARRGPFVSLPRIVCLAEEKRRVAMETRALALDMESAAIGQSAAEHRIPFAVIRGVSDLLEEDLPMDFNLFLEPADWLKGVRACLASPARLLGLRRMRTQMRTASTRITTVFERLLDDVA